MFQRQQLIERLRGEAVYFRARENHPVANALVKRAIEIEREDRQRAADARAWHSRKEA